MLQNPSKYHPNPLSHFLALHHPQAANTTHSLCTISGQQHHMEQQQQQQIYHHPSSELTISDHHNYQQHQHLGHHQLNATHTHLMDANTTLDAGKSFTIAAILGLQKNAAIECSHKEHNNVINLSRNSSTSNSYNSSPNHHKGPEKNANTGNMHGIVNVNAASSGLQTFNCDTNAALNIGIFLPKPNANSSATAFGAAVAASASHQHQSTNAAAAAHMRANSFAAAAAVAAAVNVGGGAPSALQSLQQLHQHHAQQNNLSFHRDKQKSDINSKKSSLKNKRIRTIFTPEQLERLESEFERQQYMVGPERLFLAHTLQLTEAQVKVWFQNRRIKWRKHHLEITQQRLALLRQSQLSVTRGPNRTPTFSDEAEDLKNNDSLADMTSESRQASESDLSICNDSIDADSVYADADET